MASWRDLERIGSDVGELRESRQVRGREEDFTTYADDPVGFIRDVLDGDPWSAQVEIAESVRDFDLTTCRSCNSAGKDWLCARLALWWVYARRGLALVTGPTQRQVREIVMEEVTTAFNRAESLPGDLYTSALRVGGDETRGILAFTSSEASKLTGFHAPRVLAIITEAQGVENFAYEGVHACAAGDEDRIIAVGNPLNPIGKFADINTSGHWNAIQISAEDHPNVQEGRTVIPGGVTAKFVERIAAEYGRGSDTYKSRVLGEFPSQSEGALFRREWLEAAARKYEDTRWRKEATKDQPVTLGCDIARFGPDRTVVAIRRGPVLKDFVEWRQADTKESARRIQKLANDNGIISNLEYERKTRRQPQYKRVLSRGGRIVVDSLGPGAGVIDELKGAFHLPVSEFNGGHRVRGRFLNRRVEAYWRLRDKLEAGTIAIKKNNQLWDELLATEWEPTSDGGSVKLIDKAKIKARLGRSPDLADALVYALDGGRKSGTVSFTGRRIA